VEVGRPPLVRMIEQNLIGVVAIQPNATSVWLYLFSLNRIKIVLVLPENEAYQ
jgi:hypothetical protein